MLAAVQGQLWVQCRSLSLTLFGFYSKMAIQKIRPGDIFKWLKCGLKIRKNIRFLAYMDQLLMGYEDGEIVLPSGYKLA